MSRTLRPSTVSLSTVWLIAVSLIAVLVGGCNHEEPTARLGGETAEAEAVTDADSYGDPIDADMPMTSLDAILAEPSEYEGQVVRTQGQIARVCQAQGCWMELRPGAAEGPAVRVPMAGHSFLLPRDSAGRHAVMQGRVVLQALSPEARAHLESEGALATASTLSIHATGVAID